MRVDPLLSVQSRSATTGTTQSSSSTTGLSDSTLNELGRDDFLTLLVAQLRNQDPMNPMQDSDFVAQLAQFSSLQEIRNLSEATRLASQLQVASSAAGLIGRKIEAEITDDNNKTTTVSGTVSEVRMRSGGPLLIVDGAEVALDQVTRIL